MKHELRIDGKVGTELKTRRILLAVLGKLLTQTNQHSVQPAEDVGTVVDFSFEHSYTSHEYRRGFLIERLGDGWMSALVEGPCYRRYSESVLSRRMLIVGYKLDQAGLVWSERLTGRSDNFKVCRQRGLRREGTDFPGGGLTYSNFRLADAGGFLVGRDDMADDARDLELFGGLGCVSWYPNGKEVAHQNLEGPIESHLEVILFILA